MRETRRWTGYRLGGARKVASLRVLEIAWSSLNCEVVHVEVASHGCHIVTIVLISDPRRLSY